MNRILIFYYLFFKTFLLFSIGDNFIYKDKDITLVVEDSILINLDNNKLLNENGLKISFPIFKELYFDIFNKNNYIKIDHHGNTISYFDSSFNLIKSKEYANLRFDYILKDYSNQLWSIDYNNNEIINLNNFRRYDFNHINFIIDKYYNEYNKNCNCFNSLKNLIEIEKEYPKFYFNKDDTLIVLFYNNHIFKLKGCINNYNEIFYFDKLTKLSDEGLKYEFDYNDLLFFNDKFGLYYNMFEGLCFIDFKKNKVLNIYNIKYSSGNTTFYLHSFIKNTNKCVFYVPYKYDNKKIVYLKIRLILNEKNNFVEIYIILIISILLIVSFGLFYLRK